MTCNTVIMHNKELMCINHELAESFPDTDIRKAFLTESTFLPAGKAFTDVIYTDDDDINAFTDETAYVKANQYAKESLHQLQSLNLMLMQV